MSHPNLITAPRALYSGFIDITLPPTKTAIIWDSGSNPATCTNLSTVAAAVIATLTTAEVGTRDRLLNIQSFKASPNDIVEALEKATGEKWIIEKTTTKEQLALAQECLEKGDFLPALYRWIRTFVFSERATLPNIENELLGLPKEDLQTTVEKIIKGEKI
jgi:nucleoside-diphosphate-sugar epimerase